VKDLNRFGISALRSVGASCEELGKKEMGYALIGCKGCLASDEASEDRVTQAEAMVSFDKARRGSAIVGSMPRDLNP